MLRFIVFLLVNLFVFSSMAQLFQPIIKPIGSAEKIVIRGYKGQLQIVPTLSETLKVEAKKGGKGEFDRWTFQVRQKGSVMEIIVKGPSEREDWENVRNQKNVPPFEMKVTAPHRELQVFWNQGKFVAEGLNSNLSLQMTDGDMKVVKSKGNLMLQLINGRIKVEEHKGNVDIQSFKGQTVVNKTQGALSINNYSATYRLENHQGPLEVRNHSGSMVITGVKGSSNVKNVSGVISLSEFEGSFKGEFNKGALNAKIKVLQNFMVNSEAAAITLDAPKESGAMVSLRSEKGHLRAPIHLGKLRKGRWTERRGRLKGKEQGNIKIISKYGDIVLK